MKTSLWVMVFCILFSCEAFTENESNRARYDLGEELLGGDATVFATGKRAFSKHSYNLKDVNKQTRFLVGNSFFNTHWVSAPASTTALDGLGPLFNAASCQSCHLRDGRGFPPKDFGGKMTSMLLRLSVPGKGIHGGSIGDPTYGGQLQEFALQYVYDPKLEKTINLKKEGQTYISYREITGRYADGNTYSLRQPNYEIRELGYGKPSPDLMISPRVAPQMIGLGLLESISEETIRSFADEHDSNNDGISGRPNYVWDIESQSKKLGRFGWKANQPNLRQQVAGAFNGDLGMSSSLFQGQNDTENQHLKTIPTGDDTENNQFEVEDHILDDVVFYSSHLGVPARREVKNKQVLRGKWVFEKLSCTSCHLPKIETGENRKLPELSHQIIRPFTDLLLHDMGDELADNRPDYEANGNEWRTPPLWGIGLFEAVNGHTNYLHDGRARSLEEAILWHGGEAENSKIGFTELSKLDRENVIAFLKSL